MYKRQVYTKAINLLKHQVIENNYSAAMIEIYERKLQYYQPDHAEVIKKIENQELRQEIFEAINEDVYKRQVHFSGPIFFGKT